jgi:hypothetical protein
VAALLALTAAVGAAPADRPPASQLFIDACGPAAAPEAVLESRGRGRVQVLCGSVERVANHAIRVRSECTPPDDSRQCHPLAKEFTLPVNGRDVTVEFPVELNSLSAWQMVRAIAPMTVPEAVGEGAGRRDAREHCALAGDNSDARIARMTLRCRLWTVEFVKLCSATDCRFEPAARRGTGGGVHRRRPREPESATPAG